MPPGIFQKLIKTFMMCLAINKSKGFYRLKLIQNSVSIILYQLSDTKLATALAEIHFQLSFYGTFLDFCFLRIQECLTVAQCYSKALFSIFCQIRGALLQHTTVYTVLIKLVLTDSITRSGCSGVRFDKFKSNADKDGFKSRMGLRHI